MPPAPLLYRGRTLADVRSACTHQGSSLAVALTSLCSELGLPAFTRKRELRNMHKNFDDWSSRLSQYCLNNRDNDHALAAVFVIWTRLLADASLREQIMYSEDFSASIHLAVQPSKCELRLLSGLFLTRITLEQYEIDAVRRLPFDLLEPLLHLARFLYSASNAADSCMRVLGLVVRAMIIDTPSPGRAQVNSPQKRLLTAFMQFVGTTEPYLFVDFFHYVCDAFRWDLDVDNPTILSHDYGRFLVAVVRFGDAWHRREAYTQLVCSRGSYSDSRLEFSLRSHGSGMSSLLLGSMCNYGMGKCDSTRLAETVTRCGEILRGITPDADLRSVGIRLFLLIHDDPLGASVGSDAGVKFGLPERPPPQGRYAYVDSWPDVLLAASSEVLDMTQAEVDADLEVVAPGESYTAGYIADVLRLQSYLAQACSSDWDQMQWAFHHYPDDPWVTYAYCLSHALSSAVFHAEMAHDNFIAYLSSAQSLALSGSSPLHLLLLSAVSRRAFLSIASHWMCEHTLWSHWRALFDIADSAAQQYLERCPPDGIERTVMLEVRTTCCILRHGASDLIKAKSLLEERNRAVEFSVSLYGGPRPLVDTNHALVYFLQGFKHASQWANRLRACWPATGPGEFDACDRSPRDTRETLMHGPLARHVVQGWVQTLSSAGGEGDCDWLAVPHPAFEALVGTQRLVRALSSCNACYVRRADLRTCAGCREVFYCGLECQRTHWVGLDSRQEPHRLVCTRLYPSRST